MSAPRCSSFSLAGTRAVVVNWRDVDHSLAGGSEIYAWEVARALRDGGADVELVTAREPGEERSLVRDGIRVRRRGGTLGFYPATLLHLLRRRRRTDLVVDPACGLPSFAPLALRRRTPVVLVVHHVHQAQFAAHFPAPVAVLGRWLEKVAMRRLYRRRRVVAVSESTRQEMRDQLGWSGEVGILANGADLPAAEAVDPAAQDPDRIVVLGRLVVHKRVDLVVRALGELQAGAAMQGRSLHLDVVGDGPERASLERLVARLGLADRVTFHGYVDRATRTALLARAGLHVCASDAEGWGQTVIDAAACGVPTLARDVPGLRDSVRAGETGWLVDDARDPDEVRRRLTAALARALSRTVDADERKARATACRTWAEQFDWSRMREQVRALATEEVTDPTRVGSAHQRPRETRVAA